MRILTFSAAFFFLAAATARAETFPIIDNQTVLTECGECHMAFPPQTLPKAVWEKIMANLPDHFGEDASLEPVQVKEILVYHAKNASDVSSVRAAIKWRASGSFQRITDAPRFIKKHGSCPQAVWTHKQVRSKANCLACHSTMQKDGSTDAKMGFLPPDLRKLCGEGDD